jgi:membrane AbrB-like protein
VVKVSRPPRVSADRRRGVVAASAACACGELLRQAGVPGAHLLAGLGVGITLALALAVGPQVRVSPGLYTMAQALVGGAIGSLAQSGFTGSGSVVLLLPLVTSATVVLSLAAGAVLARRAPVARATALLGMVAGGSAAVVAAADETDADARVVAVLQYLRVGLVAATAPLVAYLVLGAHARRHALHPPSPEDSAIGIAILACIALAGLRLGRRVRMPTAALTGPLLLGVGLGWLGAFRDAPVPAIVTAVALAVIGLEIGLRFNRSTLGSLGRMAPVACGLTAAIMLACAFLGEMLSLLTGISPVDGYLMTTPGGINAVLGVAAGMNGVNVALVTAAQILRLLVMILFVPALVRQLARGTEWQPEAAAETTVTLRGGAARGS